MQNKVLSGLVRLLAVVLITAMANGQAAGLPPLTHGLTPVNPPIPAPPLKLQDMDEEMIDLADFRGRVVVVNFWATWCPPCRREMTSLENLYLTTADQQLVVLAVNVGEDEDSVFPFMGELEPSPTFPVIFDYHNKAANEWMVRGLPTTYIVDPNGNIVYSAIGGRKFDHPEVIRRVRELHKASVTTAEN